MQTVGFDPGVLLCDPKHANSSWDLKGWQADKIVGLLDRITKLEKQVRVLKAAQKECK